MQKASPMLSRELLKRGRAYRCLLCQKQVGEKRYIISNIYKYVSRSIRCYTVLLFSVPFQTDDEDKLKDYIKNYAKLLRTMSSIGRRGSRYWKQGNAPRMTTCTYTKIGTLLEPPNTCTLKNWVKKSPWKLGQKGRRRKRRTGLKPFSQQPLLQFFYPVLRP